MVTFRTKVLSATLASAVGSQNITIAPATTVPVRATLRHKLLTKRSTSVVTDLAGTPDYVTSTQTTGSSRVKSTSGLVVASGASTRTVTVAAVTGSNIKVIKTGTMSDQTVSIAVACPAT